MALDPKVFKAYDVRGIYPTELDEDGAYRIGRAYVETFEPRRIAVGHDMRVSAPAMAEAAIRGATDAGVDVLDLGLVGTEMVYFAVGDLGLDGGIAVTASHNPKEYTGMKIVRRGALPVGGDSGLLDIRDRASADSEPAATPGSVEDPSRVHGFSSPGGRPRVFWKRNPPRSTSSAGTPSTAGFSGRYRFRQLASSPGRTRSG